MHPTANYLDSCFLLSLTLPLKETSKVTEGLLSEILALGEAASWPVLDTGCFHQTVPELVFVCLFSSSNTTNFIQRKVLFGLQFGKIGLTSGEGGPLGQE